MLFLHSVTCCIQNLPLLPSLAGLESVRTVVGPYTIVPVYSFTNLPLITTVDPLGNLQNVTGTHLTIGGCGALNNYDGLHNLQVRL